MGLVHDHPDAPGGGGRVRACGRTARARPAAAVPTRPESRPRAPGPRREASDRSRGGREHDAGHDCRQVQQRGPPRAARASACVSHPLDRCGRRVGLPPSVSGAARDAGWCGCGAASRAPGRRGWVRSGGPTRSATASATSATVRSVVSTCSAKPGWVSASRQRSTWARAHRSRLTPGMPRHHSRRRISSALLISATCLTSWPSPRRPPITSSTYAGSTSVIGTRTGPSMAAQGAVEHLDDADPPGAEVLEVLAPHLAAASRGAGRTRPPPGRRRPRRRSGGRARRR